MLVLEQGKPLVFGKEHDKGILFDGYKPAVVSLKDGQYTVNDLPVHDEKSSDPAIAFILANMSNYPGLPRPIGIFRDIQRSVYEDEMSNQISAAQAKSGTRSLDALLNSGETWVIS